MYLDPNLSMNKKISRIPKEAHIKPGEFAFVPIKNKGSHMMQIRLISNPKEGQEMT